MIRNRIPGFVTYIARRTPVYTPEQRERIMKLTDYNVFNFPASMLNIDLLSDSGSAALYQSIIQNLLYFFRYVVSSIFGR